MTPLMPRLSILAGTTLSLLALAHFGFAQNNPVTPPAIQPATVPAPMVVSPRTGNPAIQPLNPSVAQPGMANPFPTGVPGGPPSPTTMFQSQTPSSGGNPQSVGSGTAPIQQVRPQFGQRALVPTNTPVGTANVPVETVNTPLGRVNTPLSTGVQSAFVPGAAVSVPTTVVFNPTSPELTIQSLDPAGLYYQSGLRQGDVVLSSNGEPIQTQADFERIAAANPSQPLPLIVRRNGQEQPIEVRSRQVRNGQAHLGVRFDLDAHNAAMISSVTSGSPAEAAGLRPGDIITVINGEPITSYQQVFQFLAALRPGNQLDIRFTRRVENQTKVTLDSRPLPTQTAGAPPRARAEQIAVPPAPRGQALPK